MLGLGQARPTEINVPEIMEEFGEAAKLNALIEGGYYTGAAEFNRDRLIQEIASKIVGAEVEVRELVIPDGVVRPIEGHFRTAGDKNTVAWAKHEPDKLALVRTYAQSDGAWVRSSFMVYRSITRGKVEGVEDEGARLVVNPKSLLRLNKRDFVTVSSPKGEPLVQLKVLS